LLRDPDPEHKARAERNVKTKQDQLAKVQEKLKGENLPIKSGSSYFSDKVAKYTNDEIKTIICLFYDGKAPEQPKPGDTDANKSKYQGYLNKSTLLDKVFPDWEGLKKTESGQAILDKGAEWKGYIDKTSITGFIATLERRNLPESNKGHLKEPSYEIIPFAERKITRARAEPQAPETAATAAPPDIKSILSVKLKSAADRPATPVKPEPLSAREQLLKNISQMRPKAE